MLQTIVGNLGANPIIHETQTGNVATDFTLAVNEKGSPTASWINVRAWDGLGKRYAQKLSKGDFVKVRGQLASEVWQEPWSGEEITILSMTATYIKTLWRKPVAA